MMQFINWLGQYPLRTSWAANSKKKKDSRSITFGTKCLLKLMDTNTHVRRASASDLLVDIPPHSIKFRFSCLHHPLAHFSEPSKLWKRNSGSHTESKYLICGCAYAISHDSTDHNTRTEKINLPHPSHHDAARIPAEHMNAAHFVSSKEGFLYTRVSWCHGWV